MTKKFVAILAPALALGFLAVTAEAQQHKATRLGNPATRFAKPLKKADDLRVMLRADKMKADVAAILNEVGWKGNLEDLDRAAATAEISEIQVPTGTRLPFMSSRKNKKPHALVDVLWAGKKPIDAFAFEFSSNCVRYRLVTPKACSNFWIEELGKDTTDPKCAPPPPPPVVSRERRERDLRDAAGRVHDHRQEPAGRQQGEARTSTARSSSPTSSRTAPSSSRSPARRRPARYEVKAVSGGVSAHHRGPGEALPADLRHHGLPAPGQGRQAVHRRPLRLPRRCRRQGRHQDGQGRGRGPEGRRRRHLRDGRRRPEPQRRRHQEGRHPHPARRGDGRGRPDLDERLRGAGRTSRAASPSSWAATSARSA